MDKMRSAVVACLALMWPGLPSFAQDIEKEFEDFARQQQQAYDEFKSKADAEYESFLRAAWEAYDAFAPEPAPVRPEPPKPVKYDPKRPELPPVDIKPGDLKVPQAPVPGVGEKVPVKYPGLPDMANKPAPGVYVPGMPYTPVIVVPPTVKPGRTVYRTPIAFYGTEFELATDAVEGLSLAGIQEANVADAWKELCTKDYEQFVNDCMTLKKEKNLTDWAYLSLSKQIGEQLYGANRPNDVAFLQMFLLNKSGYKVRLAKIDDRLKLLVAPAGTIYGTPYLRINGDKYYVFEPVPDASMRIYTYKQDFADAKNLVCLNIDGIPSLTMSEENRTFTSADGKISVQTVVNKNLMDFYRDYPQCDVVIHYKAPMSEGLREPLYAQLRKAIAGKSEVEAANILLHFVQTSFQYMTDGDQFGYEKPFFPDETFYYPYCDCEDRAMLYSTLVRDLLGLETILLDYPNHIASAVRFTEKVPGDAVVVADGTRYVICDPTYIGAPVGQCMDQYKSVGPQVIY